MTMKWLPSAIALFGLTAVTVVQADEYHYVNQVVGHRALGMGGAYTAISDDPSGLFYNPAGIVYAATNNVSASVNTYQVQHLTYPDALGSADWERNSVQLLPNFFGVVQPLGKFRVGFSSSVPDSVNENQDQQFNNISVDKFIINLNNIDTTYNVGPSIAMNLSPNLSLGLNLHYHFRSAESNVNQFIYDNSQVEWVNRYLETVEHGVRPKLGLMWTPVDKISIGVTADTTFVIKSDTKFQRAVCETAVAVDGCSVFDNPDIIEATTIRPYPLQFRTALAYFASNTLLLSGEFIYNTATNGESFFTARKQTIDWALGTEWYWSPKYALRAGYYTSHANTDKTGQDPHVNHWGTTFGVSRFNRGSEVSVGGLYETGEGTTKLFSNLPSIPTNMAGFSLFISTSYSY